MILSYGPKVPAVEDSAFVADNATLVGDVSVGKDSGVWFGAVLRADHGPITVGEGTSVQDNATIHMAPGRAVVLGDHVTVGHNAVIHGATVENNVIVGMNATILDGAVVGHHSIIGAGALIRENDVIPPYSVCVGVPARVIRTMTPQQAEQTERNALEYVRLAREYKRK